jgi:hypothetical protein
MHPERRDPRHLVCLDAPTPTDKLVHLAMLICRVWLDDPQPLRRPLLRRVKRQKDGVHVSRVGLIGVLGGVGAVGTCAVVPPSGPTVMALPPQGKCLAVFQQEDGQCRNYATATIGYAQPGQAGTHTTVGSAAVGTVLGAAAGSAIGAAAGNAGAGAAIGGATGLLSGAAVGANNAAASAYDLQTRYNIAYTQCIYSLGDTVQYLTPGAYAYYDYAGEGYSWYYWGGRVSSAQASSRSTGITISITASTKVGSTVGVPSAADLRLLLRGGLRLGIDVVDGL